mgnify:CR=1 FL=1
MNLLSIKNVSYNYSDSKKKVLENINYEFEKGKFYAVTGKSGAGKSTFLSLLAGIDIPVEGKIEFKGEDIAKKGYSMHRRENVSLVFQNYNLIDYLTPLENVKLGNKKADKGMLLKLGLSEEEISRNVLRLSGGQMQRVAIARALASDSPVILADEPTGNLDEETSREIIEILKKYAKAKDKCVIVVTHSKEVIDEADIVLDIKDKKLIQRKKR